RRRLAVMRTRLQRDVDGGALRRRSGARQGIRLGMRPATWLRPAAADDDAVVDDNGADGRIWPSLAECAAPERQRKLHEAPVSGFRLLGLLGEFLFQDAEDHFRATAGR